MYEEGYIYAIYNKESYKVYVGQTKNNPEKRFRNHCITACGKNKKIKTYIHRAIKSNGKENFDYVILENCDISRLNFLEKFWIKKLNSNNSKFGYNLTNGGNSDFTYSKHSKIGNPCNRKIVKKYDFEGNLIDLYESVKEAGDSNNMSWATVSTCCNGKKNSASGFVWKFIKDSFNEFSVVKHLYKKPIVQYDVCGNFIERFSSIKEAAIKMNVQENLIARCAKGKQKTCKEFVWKFEGELFDKNKKILLKKDYRKKIDQYDFSGNFIKTYESSYQLKKLGFGKSIHMCCSGKCFFIKGYIWRYHGDKFNKFDLEQFKPVIQYSIDGKLINSFPTILKAAKIFNKQKNPYHILECCKGKFKEASGFVWRFSDE